MLLKTDFNSIKGGIMAGVKGQKSGGHSTKGVAGAKKKNNPIREGVTIRIRKETADELKKEEGKTWDDKINSLLKGEKINEEDNL
jgi:uncharacterized protein (DUF4415 family)